MTTAPVHETHDFVCHDEQLGVGQVIAVHGDHVSVEYFDSVTNPHAHRTEVPVSEARHVTLERQRRCYATLDGIWWVGRIMDYENRQYLVRLRARGEVWLDQSLIRVRWNRPLPDPLEDLIALNWWAHPVEVALRRKFLERVGQQRVAVLGLVGLGTLAVEVHEHQIEVARRVLEDPVGRFLLADEVGLGKTIEALMIARQCLLDNPRARIRIIAPTSLCSQWRQELLFKAFIDVHGGGDFPFSHVEMRAMEQADAWAESKPLDLLIIDEAHRVAAWADSPSESDRHCYAAAERLTDRARCVLLISATPSLHRSATFLALLHLLDPQRHDLKDLVGFEARLAQRHAVAAALLGVHDDDPTEILADALGDLADVVPPKSPLEIEIRALLSDLDCGEASDAQRDSIERIKLQVAEGFRVDRRMLRTRRLAVERRFPIRGRRLGDSVVVDSPAFADVDIWFERWREALLVDHELHSSSTDAVADLVGLMAERVMGAPGLVPALARLRLGVATPGDKAAVELTPWESDLVESAVPVGSEEREELLRAPRLSSCLPEDYVCAIAEHVWTHGAGSRVVLMTSFTCAAHQLYVSLRERLQSDEVALHAVDADSTANEQAVQNFVSDDYRCHVLVCDRSGEEGLNLQAADVVVLADVPLAADRLEQRLGRADRFSYRDKVLIEVIRAGEGAQVRNAWIDLLQQGYRIFERSIAAFQVAVAESLVTVRRRLLENGAQVLPELASLITEDLSAAERELTRSELLDATWIGQEGLDIAKGLLATDEDWREWRAIADGLITKSLRLVRWYHAEHSDDIISYWLKHPRVRIEPEIDGRDRMDYFVKAVSHANWARRSTYQRAVAASRSGVRLLRIGDPLIDAVEGYLRERHDDGRVTAIWRKTSCLPDGKPQAGFAFHFSNHIDLADVMATMPPTEQALLSRRLLNVLPPRSTTVYVSAEGAVLDEEDDLALLLSFEYDPRRGDSRLYPTVLAELDALIPRNWEDACQSASEAARHAARVVLGIEPVSALQASSRRLGQSRLGVLRGRSASHTLLQREAALADLLEDAIGTADARLEAVQFLVVSDENPPRPPKVPKLSDGV